MNIETILVMIFIPLIVWGGFIFSLSLAIKKERTKKKYG